MKLKKTCIDDQYKRMKKKCLFFSMMSQLDMNRKINKILVSPKRFFPPSEHRTTQERFSFKGDIEQI